MNQRLPFLMANAAPANIRAVEQPLQKGVAACFLAGVCTYLNMYATQPLLPLLQRLFHASELEVSLTVSATILGVALAAPIVGLIAESIGRKKVIVPCLYALAVPTLLAATSRNLGELVLWRFMQGLLVPGVVAVIIAYIGEEFAGPHVGRAMSAYVTGTVLGGFGGRYMSGLISNRLRWQDAFLCIALVDLLGATVLLRSLPSPQHFARTRDWRQSRAGMLEHLHNGRLLAVFGMAFSILFAHVGVFTYVNFHLGRPPYNLNPEQLGMVFLVYLLGLAVTPFSGRLLDRFGLRRTALLAFALSAGGLLLTLASQLWLIIAGLALFSSGVFSFQAAGTVQTGVIAGRARSTAAGLYLTFYYVGGSLGGLVTDWPWLSGGWRACVYVLLCMTGMALLMGFLSSAAGNVRMARPISHKG